jgi:ureidoglycolate lyase
MVVSLEIQPLSKAAFAPFGDVIETDGAEVININQGTTERFHDLARIQTHKGGHTLVNIFRGQPRPRPIEISMMEYHPLGSQAFIPLQPAPWLVVVARPGKTVTVNDLVAFQAAPDQGVNYHAAVWHHPLLVEQNNHDFLVVDRGGPGDNLVEHWFMMDRSAVATLS